MIADEVLPSHNYCTELNPEALRYVIDIARPSMGPEEILQQFNDNVSIMVKGGKEKKLDWTDGLKYKLELADAVLPFID